MQGGKVKIKHKNRIKKVIILLCAVLFLFVVGVFLLWNYERENTQDLKPQFTNTEEIANGIREHLNKHYIKIEISYNSGGDNGDYIIDIATDWVNRALEPTGVSTEGDYMRNQIGGYDIEYSHKHGLFSKHCTVYISPKYYTTLEQEEEVTARIEEIISSLSFNENTSDYEKVRAIHDYLYENVDYDLIHKDHDNYHKNSTAFGALIYKKASCQGYSVAMNRLLLEVGIDNRIIKGEVSKDGITEYHAWNLVKIGEFYYNVDVTLDKELESQDYFLKCDENFLYHSREIEFDTESFHMNYPMSENDYIKLNNVKLD